LDVQDALARELPRTVWCCPLAFIDTVDQPRNWLVSAPDIEKPSRTLTRINMGSDRRF
jgi:hypothetical protein